MVRPPFTRVLIDHKYQVNPLGFFVFSHWQIHIGIAADPYVFIFLSRGQEECLSFKLTVNVKVKYDR